MGNYEVIKGTFIAVIAGIILWFFTSVREDIHTITVSIGTLNSQIAVLVERVTMYNKRVDEHEYRLRKLEFEKNKEDK